MGEGTLEAGREVKREEKREGEGGRKGREGGREEGREGEEREKGREEEVMYVNYVYHHHVVRVTFQTQLSSCPNTI